jgi:putative toxin-antitoxin system antitoxin component (TIGR02293 family)
MTMPIASSKAAHFVLPPQMKRKSLPGRILGLKEMNLPSLIRLIDKGLPWSTVLAFAHVSGFSQQQLADFLGLPARTFARRRHSGTLDRAESERLLRLAEIFDAALGLFDGDADDARQWLASPVRGLDNAAPIDYARTELGAREVRNLIGRLEDGVFS